MRPRSAQTRFRWGPPVCCAEIRRRCEINESSSSAGVLSGAKTRKQQKVKTNSLDLTNPNWRSCFVSRETSGVKPLFNKAFQFRRSRALPGGRRCNRKIADVKTDVFWPRFHTKTQKITRIPSVFANAFQSGIEISQFWTPGRPAAKTNKRPCLLRQGCGPSRSAEREDGRPALASKQRLERQGGLRGDPRPVNLDNHRSPQPEALERLFRNAALRFSGVNVDSLKPDLFWRGPFAPKQCKSAGYSRCVGRSWSD
jgi:hypothetical protein